MRILLFEFVSGGGWWCAGTLNKPPASLLREGKSMLRALATDFAALPNCEVVLLQDRRVRHKVELPNVETRIISRPVELFRTLQQIAKQVDTAILIAPEAEDHLHNWAEKWGLLGGKLLGPDTDFIRIASSKTATADQLSAAGVRVPRGMLIGWPEKLPRNFPLPAILKPDDGCGSQGILRVNRPADGAIRRRKNAPMWRLEQFREGLAVSVSLLAGPRGAVALPACLQWLAEDGSFAYHGGMTPIKDDLNARAERLALAAAKAMPATVGYFGIDMVLGSAADGSEDYVIEINPRLTTSYIGLRAICRTNLAQTMLDVAAGRECDLSTDGRRVQFDTSGNIIELS